MRATVLVDFTGHHPHRLGSRLVTPEVGQSEPWLNFHPSWKFLSWSFLLLLLSGFSISVWLPFHRLSPEPLPLPTLKILSDYGLPLWLSSLSLWTVTLDLVIHQWPQRPLVLLTHWSLPHLYVQCWLLSGIQNHYSQPSHLLTLVSTDANFPPCVTTKCWDNLHTNYKYEASELTVRDNRWSVKWSIYSMDNSVYHIKNELSIRSLFN